MAADSSRPPLRPVEGGEQIARFYAAIVGVALNVTILERMVDGQRPGHPGRPVLAQCLWGARSLPGL
jgi:hypothetical protein